MLKFKYIVGGMMSFHNNVSMLKASIIRTYRQSLFAILPLVFICLSSYTFINDKFDRQSVYLYGYQKFTGFLHTNPTVNMTVFKKETLEPIRVERVKIQTINTKIIQESAYNFFYKLYDNLIISMIFGILFMFLSPIILSIKGRKEQSDNFIRGIKFEKDVKKINKKLIKDNKQSPISIGGLHIVKDSETKHMELLGTTGVGKTVLIKELSSQINDLSDNYSIYIDVDGEFIANYYDPQTDIILNPFDNRSANWNIFEEINSEEDYDMISASLIPESGKDPFWYETPRTLFSSVLKMVHSNENVPNSIEVLLKYALLLDIDRLAETLKNTPAEQLVDGSLKKTALSIRAVLVSNIKSFRFLFPTERQYGNTNLFSFNQWVKAIEDPNKTAKRRIFISFRDKQLISIRPMLTLWISLVTSHIKSLNRSRTRRIWLFIDELTKLGHILSLADTLSIARNYGLCCVLGYQNFAQLKTIYGYDQASSISSLLSTKYYFRVPDYEMAERLSKNIGSQEVYESSYNRQLGVESVKDGSSINQARVTKRLVTSDEILGLADLHCYALIIGEYPRTKISLTPKQSTTDQLAVDERTILPEDIDKKIEAYIACKDSAVYDQIDTKILFPENFNMNNKSEEDPNKNKTDKDDSSKKDDSNNNENSTDNTSSNDTSTSSDDKQTNTNSDDKKDNKTSSNTDNNNSDSSVNEDNKTDEKVENKENQTEKSSNTEQKEKDNSTINSDVDEKSSNDEIVVDKKDNKTSKSDDKSAEKVESTSNSKETSVNESKETNDKNSDIKDTNQPVSTEKEEVKKDVSPDEKLANTIGITKYLEEKKQKSNVISEQKEEIKEETKVFGESY